MLGRKQDRITQSSCATCTQIIWAAFMTIAPSTPQHQRNPMLAGNGLAIASTLVWALSFPAAEILFETWTPLALAWVKFLLAVGFLVPLWMLHEGWEALRRAPWLRGIIVAGPTIGLSTYLLLVSQNLTNAVTAAILSATMPIAGAAIEVVTGARRLRATFVAGLALSIIGGIVATGSVKGISLGWGAVTMAASVFLYALGSYWSVRKFPELSVSGRTAVTIFGSAVFITGITALAALAGQDVLPSHQITGKEILLLLVFGMLGLGAAQVLWLAAVEKLGVAITTFHVNAAPFNVMLFMVALGETWSWRNAIGAAIVVAGVLLAQKRKRRV
jgi:drug/metabolite transporter (DMT)-like permease